MTDLISRADAIEAVEYNSYGMGSRASIKAIKALPSAELPIVQNMHKGKWIKKQVFNPELDRYVPLIECSVCGYEPYFGGSESKYNYCPNCGARMKDGAE